LPRAEAGPALQRLGPAEGPRVSWACLVMRCLRRGAPCGVMSRKGISGLKVDQYVSVCVHAVAHRLRSKQRLEVIDLWSIRPERGSGVTLRFSL
jgi:hypothetical protein